MLSSTHESILAKLPARGLRSGHPPLHRKESVGAHSTPSSPGALMFGRVIARALFWLHCVGLSVAPKVYENRAKRRARRA